MKKLIHRGMMFLLAFCMVANMSLLSSFAIDRDSSADLSAYDPEIVQMLRDFKVYSDEDIIEILEYDKTHPVNVRNSSRVINYPPNPKEGDTVTMGEFTVSYDTLRMSGTVVTGGAAKLALELAKITGWTALACTGAAVILWQLISDQIRFDYAEITLKARYGMTNDGYMGWTPYTEWQVYY